MAPMGYTWAWGKLIRESKKSRFRISLINPFLFISEKNPRSSIGLEIRPRSAFTTMLA
jgi:hypothetical protein